MSYIESSREPLRPVVSTADDFDRCLVSLADATGPVAFDTERAHGHRYWPKAYLLQIRREGAGTWLIDPVAFEGTRTDLSDLVTACRDATWLIHAASQDLPCMTELGIVPPSVFDTELAARLLGKPGAGLGPLLEGELGIQLRKAHSADNWSRRPLPEAWLIYAALDVDYLIELAETLSTQLEATGRLEWALQESAEELVRYTAPPVPRVDPWRRLKEITTLKTVRQLAVARALWEARDAIAQRRDRPPGWILPDSAIIEAASRSRDEIPTRESLRRVSAFAGTPGARWMNDWLRALDDLRDAPESTYPPRRVRTTGIPQPRTWERINPDAARRWSLVRPLVEELACDLGGLQASLIAPPQVLQEALFTEAHPSADDLTRLGARPWQVEFLAPLIDQALGA